VAPTLPIIVLPGMSANDRLFGPQLARFPTLRVPRWIEPNPRESLRAYSARMARSIDPGGPCIVGGASFGGIVALEMTAHLHAVACVLIGSVRSPAELPLRWRILRPLAHVGPDRLGRLARGTARLGRRLLTRMALRHLRRLSQPDGTFARWATCAVLRWSPGPTVPRCRVFQIHGEWDRTLPVSATRPDMIVPGGRHTLTLFSPRAVNEFLIRVVEQVSSDSAAPDTTA